MRGALSLPGCMRAVADLEDRGYWLRRETELGVVLRHPDGAIVTVLRDGATRGGDAAGAGPGTVY